MTERLIVLLLLALLVFAAALLVRQRVRTRLHEVAGIGISPTIQRLLAPHDSGILYFYGPHCTTCARQAAVLDTLDTKGRPIVRLDATVERELADDLAIMTVPSTAVVERGTIEAVNLGYTSRERLLEQLQG